MNDTSGNRFDPTQKIVNQIAATAISSQLKSAARIDVNLETEVPKALQGDANSVAISGKKVILGEDIQLEEIDLTCQDLSLNLAQAILGRVAFDRPGNFQVKLVFATADCDRLLNSKYVKVLLHNLSLDLDPQPSNFELRQGQCSFNDNGSISLIATIVLNRAGKPKTARFKITFRFHERGARVEFIGGAYFQPQALDWDETAAVMSKAKDLLYLRHFANEDLHFTITEIQVRDRQLIVLADTHVIRLPDSISQSVESVSSDIDRRANSDKT